MRGAVAAGMCLVLEAAGLMSSFDRVYGCSSGAVTGAFAAAGQASVWATSFEDCACRTFIDPVARVARRAGGRPRLPLRRGDRPAPDAVRGRAGRRPRVPRGRGVGHARGAAGAARLREHGGPAGRRAGELRDPGADRRTADLPRRADGGRRPARADPVSHGTARGSDARDRPALARRELPLARQDKFAERMLARAHPELAPLLESCSWRYNRDAAELERRAEGSPLVQQIAVPAGSHLVSAVQHRLAPASPTTSGSAPSRWPPRSTARAPRGSGSRSPSCSPGASRQLAA